jgi:geranylgeranyl pyrophosphate synthase
MSTPHRQSNTNLPKFTAQVLTCARRAVNQAGLHSHQAALLQQTLDLFESHADPHSPAQPLGLLYLTLRANRAAINERAIRVGAFCALYVCALDLFDDVQDDDLAGKPHADTGPAFAINSAICLLFLGLDELGKAIELETDAGIRLGLLRTFNRTSVIAVGAQHRDLLAEDGATSLEDVVARDQGKTSSVGLFLECGALLAGCSPKTVTLYRQMGENLASLVQIVDDLRDIYGKDRSPDLESGKLTYPVACLLNLSTADRVSRFQELSRRLPDSLPQIRDLFYEAGAVDHCAQRIEQLRTKIHGAVAETENRHGAHRVLLRIVDAVAGQVYEPQPLPGAEPLGQSSGRFHRAVCRAIAEFTKNTAALNAPQAPQVEPWHLPHFLYDPEQCVIYHPDVDDLPQDVLAFHSQLLGETDLTEVASTLTAQLPPLVAHEMFHVWRHHTGQLTDDHWHEEYVANRLAVAYSQKHCPAALDHALRVGSGVLNRLGNRLTGPARQILSRCQRPTPDTDGYGLDILDSAVLHVEMVRQLATQQLTLYREVQQLLHADRKQPTAA